MIMLTNSTTKIPHIDVFIFKTTNFYLDIIQPQSISYNIRSYLSRNSALGIPGIEKPGSTVRDYKVRKRFVVVSNQSSRIGNPDADWLTSKTFGSYGKKRQICIGLNSAGEYRSRLVSLGN